MCVRQGSGGCEGKQALWKKEAEHTEAGSAEVCRVQDGSRIFQTEVTEGARGCRRGGRGLREGTATTGKTTPQQVKELRASTLGLRGPPGEPYSL